MFARNVDLLTKNLPSKAILAGGLLWSAVAPAQTLTSLYTFDRGFYEGYYANHYLLTFSGYGPNGITRASDGNFYVATYGGGFVGAGTIYRLTPEGAATKIAELKGAPGPQNPSNALTLGADGNLYGTTQNGGFFSGGTAFTVTTDGQVTTLASFAVLNGDEPSKAKLVLATDGELYGVSLRGGLFGAGTIFRLTTQGAIRAVASFERVSELVIPNPVSLLQASDGDFYGVTTYGGDLTGCNGDGCGTVFRLTSKGHLSTFATFAADTGPAVPTGLIQASDGNFYGTSFDPGTGFGTVFKLTSDGTITTLYAPAQYVEPAGLIQGQDGNLYVLDQGTAVAAGGSVFSVALSGGQATTVALFDGEDGAMPNDLTQLTDGSFVGSTISGGYCSATPTSCGFDPVNKPDGTLFEIQP